MPSQPHTEHPVDRLLPRFVAVAYSIWMVAWIAIILDSAGLQNFWWLCNLAQFIVLYSLWTRDRLLLSSQAGTLAVVGLVWGLDLFAGMLLGGSPTGTTAYMFDSELGLAHRLSSTYHLWLPILVIWALHRRHYDHRGPWLQCAIGSSLIVGGWLFGDAHRNLNYAHEPFGIEQVWLPDMLWIPLLCLATALLVYLPGHVIVTAILSGLRRRKR